MKNFIIIFLASIALYSCGNTEEQPQDKKAILETINNYKMEIVEIEGKINDLNSSLVSMEGQSNQGSILVGIITMKAEPFTHYIDITGNVESHMQANISPELNGLINNIYVKEGQYVKKGTKLASIDTEMTQNSIEEVETQLELAKSIYKKQKQLWDKKIGSEIQYLQAKTKKESLEKKLKTLHSQLKKAIITAPFSGIIETVNKKVGEFGSPNMPLFYMVNLEDLKITANISESFLPYVNVNDEVTVKFPTFPNMEQKSNISVIGSVVNPNNRTIELQIPINNKDKKLIPNIIAQVKLADQYFDTAFVVPSIVVKNDAHGETYIYTVEENEGQLFAQKKTITTGKSYGNKTMVLSGLKQGDKVITKAYNLVKNGSRIRMK